MKQVNRVSENNTEAIRYFKSKKLYEKLFLAFKKKYESLGKIGGSVSISSFSEKELEELAQFLGLRTDVLFKKKKVALLQFEKQLEKYRFDDSDLKHLLEMYFEEPLISNRERLENKANRQWSFISYLKLKYEFAAVWLDYLEWKSPDSYWIYRLMEESHEKFETYVSSMDCVLKNLPHNPVRLPVFAQRITGNPHAFDRNQNLGRLLLHLLAVKCVSYDPKKFSMPSTSEDINELLLSFNILRDDITNFVTVANLMAETDDSRKIFWDAACKTHTVLNVPIRELLNIESLFPFNQGEDVWIIENSGVFSSILDVIPDAPLICTHGQFKLAAWKCIDLLVKNQITLNYSSDLDPEGIGMAQRLLDRYPDFVKLWEMTISSYDKSISVEDSLSETRLKKLRTITNHDLLSVSSELMRTKVPGYQEALLDDMIEELQSRLK